MTPKQTVESKDQERSISERAKTIINRLRKLPLSDEKYSIRQINLSKMRLRDCLQPKLLETIIIDGSRNTTAKAVIVMEDTTKKESFVSYSFEYQIYPTGYEEVQVWAIETDSTDKEKRQNIAQAIVLQLFEEILDERDALIESRKEANLPTEATP